MRLSQLTQPIKEGNYPEPRKMQVTQADKEANTEAWKRFKAGDPRYEWHDSNLKEFGPDERYIKVGNTTGIANKKTGSIVGHTKIGNTKVSANNHMNADGTQGNINATGKIAGVKVKASNNLKGTNPKLKVNDLTVEGYNDDEWSDKEKENLEYTVWVGGTEVNDHWLTYDEAKVLYDKFKAQGYDDIQLDARIKQEIPTDSKLISKEFHGIDWDKINEESEEEKYEKLEVAYGHGGEAGLAKALGMTEPQLNDIIDELAAESHEWARQVLTADDDRDVIIDRIMDLAADGRYDDYHTSKWDEAYNPETGRDPNVDTTEWDNLIAKAKKKQGISDEEEVFFNYGDIGGNIIVNPKSTIEDQIFELLNRYYDISAMEFDPSKIEIQESQTNEDIYDDGKLRLDPKTGKYDPEEVKQMQQQGAEMARQKANQNMRDKLNRDIDVSQKAHTITVEYDLELDTPKSKNPLLKKHYQLMKKFNVFISMPQWEEGPPDSGFGAWFADVRGSKENLKGWLKAWEYDYDERDYEDMGLEESMNEDEEAVAARDEFLKVMDMKPKGGLKDIPKAIDTIKKIVADKQNQQVKFDDGKMKVDLYTASAVSQIYDAVKPETQEKIDNMLRTKEGMLKMSNFAFTKLNEGIQRIREGKGQRIDEWIPLAIGAARVLGPLITRQIAKHGVKGAIKNIPRISNAVSTKGKLKTAKKVWDKTPLRKTGTALGALDVKMGPGLLHKNIANAVSNAPQNYLDKKNQEIDDFHTSMWTKPGYESKTVYSKDSKRITEFGPTDPRDKNGDGKDDKTGKPLYTGVDGVPDKNGKMHDPNSPKGKMIINMKKKNSKSGNPDKKRIAGAIVKKGWDMAATGGKKFGKMTADMLGKSGIGNPFDLKSSKYSPEDKAIEMMREATKSIKFK